MRRLEELRVVAFKSIRDQTLQLNPLNVLIGANGAGKSNLIQAFGFVRKIRRQKRARYSLERGADALLFRGRKMSPSMCFCLRFGEGDFANS